ncbi:MAG: DUF3179 domain-containing protein [Acidimicrobiia bacterium]
MTLQKTLAAAAVLALVAAACTSGDAGPATTETTETTVDGSSDQPTTAPTGSSETAQLLEGVADSSELPGDLPAVTGAWATDWTRTTIDLSELLIGIFASDPRDAIAPIDEPKFESIADGAAWLGDREPGLVVEYEDGARFYPLSILTLHEVINDELGDLPVAITFCPLCNSGVVFERRIDGVTHRFGVSGLLRKSDLVMWDDLTTSLWQQITGEAIVGTFAGTRLTAIPSAIASFSDYRETFPDGAVLSRDTGFGYSYGVNPYEFYSSRQRPFGFFDGELDDRFPALERVIGVTVGGAEKAYPFSIISPVGAVNDSVGGERIVVLWGGDTADALDGRSIADSQAIGTGVAYLSVVNGQTLTFVRVEDGVFEDEQTGSRWTILGRATDGPLAGQSLTPAIHRNEFWFAWAAFFPDAPVYTG